MILFKINPMANPTPTWILTNNSNGTLKVRTSSLCTIVRQSDRKLVQQKFWPSANMSTNHKTVLNKPALWLAENWNVCTQKVEISVALAFRQTVVQKYDCANARSSRLLDDANDKDNGWICKRTAWQNTEEFSNRHHRLLADPILKLLMKSVIISFSLM